MLQFDILTPTVGSKHLSKLLQSVNQLFYNENYKINHTIIVDGDKFKDATNEILTSVPASPHINRNVVFLPFNTGADGYLCNKIYAAFVHLTSGDYIIFMDDDNWVEPDHIENYYKIIIRREKTDWLYSLRNIVDQQDNYVCRDLCESLGNIHSCYYNFKIHLIDTNCYCISREIAILYSMFWNRKSAETNLNPDRIYSDLLMKNEKNFECTFKFTVNYRVADKKGRSPTMDVFTEGNDFLLKTYGKIVWDIKDEHPTVLAIKDVDIDQTQKIIANIYKGNLKFNSKLSNDIDASESILINENAGYCNNGTTILNVKIN